MTDVAFVHPNYELDPDGTLRRKSDAESLMTSDARNAEDASVIGTVTEYVQARMRCVIKTDSSNNGPGQWD